MSTAVRKEKVKPGDNQMNRFLYSILKQKCLKDIDWQRVADEQGISSAHAARMRYSRFKDSMEGKTASRRARAPPTPRKSTAQRDANPQERIPNAAQGAASRARLGNLSKASTTSTADMVMSEDLIHHSAFVKAEPGSAAQPLTPASPCPSPPQYARPISPSGSSATGAVGESSSYSVDMMDEPSPRFNAEGTSFTSVEDFGTAGRDYYSHITTHQEDFVPRVAGDHYGFDIHTTTLGDESFFPSSSFKQEVDEV